MVWLTIVMLVAFGVLGIELQYNISSVVLY